jgi:ATP-dependent Lon protease
MAVDEARDLMQSDDQSTRHAESGNPIIALLPLKNVVLLPKSIMPIIVGRPHSIQAVEYALKNNKSMFVTAQKDPDIETPHMEDLFNFGTRATILQVMRMPNGALKILAEGICRAKVMDAFHTEGFLY